MKSRKRKPLDYRAKLVIHDADTVGYSNDTDWSYRRGIGQWLRKLAKDIQYGKEQYAKTFTAKFMK